MAALWPNSRIPQIDANGDPLVGAQAFFYNVGTTTPQVVYSDSALATPRTQPVETDANGRFPAVFLNTTPGTYRQRVLDADDVVIFDDDGISVPQAADYVPPDTGSTDATLLFRTGDMKFRYATGTHSGWVRAAGRTIGSATSGATERANADTSDLFQHLWTQDANLAVSGGRGATAAGDFAANKTIVLPDIRDRVILGLGDMGNTDAARIADALTDASTNTTLGATAGASTVVLDTTMIPAHNHVFTGDALPSHGHTYHISSSDANAGNAADGGGETGNGSTSNVSAGTPTGTIGNTGGGLAHPNLQPGLFMTAYIKL